MVLVHSLEMQWQCPETETDVCRGQCGSGKLEMERIEGQAFGHCEYLRSVNLPSISRSLSMEHSVVASLLKELPFHKWLHYYR